MSLVQYGKCPDCGSWPGDRHKSFCREQWKPAPARVLEQAKRSEEIKDVFRDTPRAIAEAWRVPELKVAGLRYLSREIVPTPRPDVEVLGLKEFQKTLQEALAKPTSKPAFDITSLDTLTHQEKVDLLAKLAASMPVGPLPLPTDPKWAILPINSGEDVKPGECATSTASVQEIFRPQRIVILEQEIDHLPSYVPLGSTCSECGHHSDNPHGAFCSKGGGRVSIPRSAWEVTAGFIGNRCMWPSMGVISGEAFGPYGTMDIECVTAQPGLWISLQVRHNLGRPVPFRAVMLGRRVQPERAPRQLPGVLR